MRIRIILLLTVMAASTRGASHPPSACDIGQAVEICSALPLDPMEGVWIYPEDNVTVLILRNDNAGESALPSYDVSVVQSDDCRLSPGDLIGHIDATPDANKFEISLFTEKNKDILQKETTCLASLSKDSDAMILKGGKSKLLNFRFHINLSRLLPNFWRVVRITASGKQDSSVGRSPAGMVKIYPSYDGNGSSRRAPRYL